MFRYALQKLKKIQRILQRRAEIVRHIECIPAKVPILKVTFKKPYEDLEVDINVNNLPGIYNSFLLHYYSRYIFFFNLHFFRIDDRFPTLALVVKNWAKIMEIGDASQGTLNRYLYEYVLLK